MQLTIVPEDGVVIYNNTRYENVDLSSVDPHIHAVQFQGNKGWIEYKDNTQTLLTSLNKFQAIINQCEAIKTFEEMRALDPYYGMSAEERLEAKRAAKTQEIQEAYTEAENSPYTMVDLTYAISYEGGIIMAYWIKYRAPGQIFWRKLKRVIGDAVEPGLFRWFYLENGQTIFIPLDSEVVFSKERTKVEANKINQETGGQVNICS